MISVSDLWFGIPDPTTGKKWDAIDQHVANLLIASGWTQLPDSGLAFLKQMEWQDYRDTLKSIRDDFSDPDTVVFPVEPQ
jgi:hypothetical protein